MDERFMALAIAEAKKAALQDEVPIGAVVVCHGEVVGRGFNQKVTEDNALYHAEIIALNEASTNLKTWHLEECTMYVTLEPCAMCAGAMLNMRLGRVVIGTRDERMGCCGTVLNLLEQETFNHHIPATFGVCQAACADLLSSFFKEVRKRNKIKKLRRDV